MDLWGSKKKEAAKKDESKELAQGVVDDLSCENFFHEYKTCIIEKKASYKECLKIMDQFRFCLIRREELQAKDNKGGSKNINPQLFKEQQLGDAGKILQQYIYVCIPFHMMICEGCVLASSTGLLLQNLCDFKIIDWL
eukprot:TRINITY_DN9553_c0_g1_i1.p1 TRINITY_DN9553_c0_g1~~TRINITY_DN9553_c0_g1_i1.p1  ORF type:complete len:138 (+),score=17.20 TRINITY_DN9553_c0_g1_i1:89-502(+)